MVTRYFVVGLDEALDYKANLTSDNDILPISNLQSIVVGNLVDGRKIIKAVLPEYLIASMREATDLDDPLTMEGVIALDIAGKFAGSTPEEVLAMFPELVGQKEIGTDEDGNPIMKDKLKRVSFSGEN